MRDFNWGEIVSNKQVVRLLALALCFALFASPIIGSIRAEKAELKTIPSTTKAFLLVAQNSNSPIHLFNSIRKDISVQNTYYPYSLPLVRPLSDIPIVRIGAGD